MPRSVANDKYRALLERLSTLDSAAVAFSGGVDSTLLLHAAHESLGSRAVAITALSPLFPRRELRETETFCRDRDIEHVFVATHELENEAFRENPPNRCYLCKTGLMRAVIDAACAHGIKHVVEGTNVDDENDYRPGTQAIVELGVTSPLKEVGLAKSEIRDLSREKNLPTWDKPSFACLASRFAFGEQISAERLAIIDEAEQFLLDRGFRQLRVRFHGPIARIEVQEDEISRFIDAENRKDVDQKLKQLGFKYVALDLGGYKTGSMNMTHGGQTPAAS